MEVLKLGAKNNEVKIVQTKLKDKGYIIYPDGDFGPGTELIIKKFQKDNGMDSDGIFGDNSWNALDEERFVEDRIDKTSFILPEKNYYQELQFKTSIVLHHTESFAVRKSDPKKASMGHFYYWKGRDQHVCTPFSVDHFGNIYQHFNPLMWAWHLGLGKKEMEKETIGIELTNEGHMEKRDDGFVWFNGNNKYNRPQDEPVHKEWRGYEWYAPYSDAQVEATAYLVNVLCWVHKIEKNLIDDNDFHSYLLSGGFTGVYSHCNVRDFVPFTNEKDKNKRDLSPGFPFKSFAEKLK